MMELIGRAKTGWAAVDITPANSLAVNDNYANNVTQSISVSSDGTRVAIGINTLYENGVVKIFFFNGTAWVLEKTINNQYPSFAAGFGTSVTLSGDGLFLVIGYPGYSTNSAGVYFFYTRSGTAWTARGVVTEPVGPGANNKFANSVNFSKDGNYVIMGSPGKLSAKGNAYVYQRASATALTYKATLPNTFSVAGDLFGQRVLMDNTGTRCVVMSPGCAAMNVFVGGGASWALERTLTSLTFGDWDDVSSDSGCTIIAVSDISFNGGRGKVTLYKRTGTAWAYLTQITEPTPGINRYFGRSVSVSADGTKVLISSVSTPSVSNNPRAYIYNIAADGVVSLSKTLGCSAADKGNDYMSKYSHGGASSDFKKIILMTRQAGVGDADIIESFNA